MSNKNLLLTPQHSGSDPDWWFYEEPMGILVVVPGVDDLGTLTGDTRQVTISWAKIRAALKRKDKP